MPVRTIDWIDASAQDVEKFVREYLDATTTTKKELSFMGDRYVDLTFTDYHEDDRLEGWLRWADVRLIETQYGTMVIKTLDDKAIYDFCKGDTVQHVKLTRKFGETLNRLHEKILQKFRKGVGQLVKPEGGASRFEWLAWRDAERKAGRKMTYKQLAQQSGYAEASFKQASLLWRKTQKDS